MRYPASGQATNQPKHRQPDQQSARLKPCSLAAYLWPEPDLYQREPPRLSAPLSAANPKNRAVRRFCRHCPARGCSNSCDSSLSFKGNHLENGATPPRHRRFRRGPASSQQRASKNVALQQKRPGHHYPGPINCKNHVCLGTAWVQLRRTSIAHHPLTRRRLVFFTCDRTFRNQAATTAQRHFLDSCAVCERFF